MPRLEARSTSASVEVAGRGRHRPLPGTPVARRPARRRRPGDAPPDDVDPATISEVDRLSGRGVLYGHWQRQHAGRPAEAAKVYPRPGRSRTLLKILDPDGG